MTNYELQTVRPPIKYITSYLESIAPLSYQESYDNAGLIVGDGSITITNVLVTLDCTEAVVDEAIAKNCNLIVAHHPIVFKGLKKFNGKNYVERAIIKAIKNDVAIYAIHTNLDNVLGGVNSMISEKLELRETKILAPKSGFLNKLVTFVPIEYSQKVLAALFDAGVGQIGNYDHCSFRVNGHGNFRPNDKANPFVGTHNEDEAVNEDRIEVVFPTHLSNFVLTALKKAHPYEEVAYYLSSVLNQNQEVGSGMIGILPEAMSVQDFFAYLKQKMNLSLIKHTAIIKEKVQKIALCGGSGGFLLPDAIKENADVFITADYKYHEFFDADGHLMICDIGHYESENCTKELLQRILSEKFSTFATILSEINTNPVFYY